jgi:uncharacterized protein YukE
MADISTILGAGAAADPAAIRALAARLGQVHNDVTTIRSSLRSGDGQTHWTGRSAMTFRATLQTTAPDLERLATSHDEARAALSAYADAVEDLKRRAAAVAQEHERVDQRATAADAEHRDASTALVRAEDAEAMVRDPQEQARARGVTAAARVSVDAAAARQRSARDDVDAANAMAARLRDEFSQAEKACCAALDRAAHNGLYTSTFASMLHRVEHAFAPVANGLGFVGGIVVKTVVDAVLLPEDLATAFGDLMTGHGDLADVRQVLDDVGAIVTIIGVGALVVGTGGAGAVALGAASAAVGGAKFGVDAELVNEGRLSRNALLVDGAEVALSGAGVAAAAEGDFVKRFGADAVANGEIDPIVVRLNSEVQVPEGVAVTVDGTRSVVESVDSELADRLVQPQHAGSTPMEQAIDRLRGAFDLEVDDARARVN